MCLGDKLAERRGLVFKAHVYHSTLGLIVIKKKKKKSLVVMGSGGAWAKSSQRDATKCSSSTESFDRYLHSDKTFHSTLVCKAHRLLSHSTLGLSVIRKKKKKKKKIRTRYFTPRPISGATGVRRS